MTDEPAPAIWRVATLSVTILLLSMTVPATELAPEVPDLVGSAEATHNCPVDILGGSSERGPGPTECDPCHDGCVPGTDPCDVVDCGTDPCDLVDCNPDPGDHCRTVYRALGGLGIYRTSSVNDCIPDPSTEPCDYGPCGPPPIPNHCNYVDCRIIDGFLDGGGTGDFDSSENKVCDQGDPRWLSDQDGDGEFDCFDNDNDGDGLTDELEYKTEPYDMNNAFTDGVVRDDWDIAPGTTDFELAGINVPTIDMGDSGCDGVGGEPADPYIRRENGGTTIRVRYGANSSTGFTMESETPLKEPWTKDDHLDSHDGEIDKEPFDPGWTLDGQSDADVGPGAFDNHRYSLPHNVSAFGVNQAGEEPAIQLTFGLRDHDHTLTGDEEHIDLGDGAPLDAALSYELRGDGSLDKPVPRVTEGDATCFAKIVGAFDDIVPGTTNDIAVYRAVNPHKMIYTDTV